MVKQFDEKSVTIRNQIYEIPEGTMILKEGEINLDMYKILSGNVEMYTGYGTDNEVLLGMLGTGACFGEFGILTKRPAIYTIIAYSNIKILRITEDLIMDFMKDNPENVLKIMQNMANLMMKMQSQIEQLGTELNVANNSENKVFSDMLKNMLREYAIFDNNVPKSTDETEGIMRFMSKQRLNVTDLHK